ncbi:hypothetical protein [Sulfurimonas sp.]|uniref:hypothetical protein n=1 Tax=Sulfurimonas sp. TaxID=2022749 RepID=UPI0025CC6937|nr:hypothetical protein [Sulfurimonas sp.]
MIKLNLPHQAPVRFAKYIISKDETSAIVRAEFESLPSLAMLVEAAAQSSAAFSDGKGKMGFLVTLKNVKLIQEAKVLKYDITVTYQHALEALTYFSFEVNDDNTLVASGVFVIALQ